MAKIWEMLDAAYVLINSGFLPQARSIIEKILCLDPQNIEVWEAYLNTFEYASDLETAKEMVNLLWDKKVKDDYLDANRKYVLRRINERMSGL